MSNTSKLAHLFILWFASLVYALGLVIFYGVVWMSPVFFLLAYIALLLAVLITYLQWRDLFNPIFLIFAIGFMRFSLPGLLLLLGIKPNVQIFQIMGLKDDNWLLGHVLALMGLSGVIIGWFLPSRFLWVVFRKIPINLKTDLSEGTRYIAILGMLLGFITLFVFVESNASIEEVIWTGKFRATEVQEGTGKYFYLALMLIASSVVLSAYLAKEKCAWWIVLFPVLIAMIFYWVLGGRMRALTPLAAGLLLLWYRKGDLKIRIRYVLTTMLIMVLLIMVLRAGQLYRGGFGVSGMTQALSISELFNYSQWALWADLGQLHSLAGAVVIGPSTLGGKTFFIILWPLSEVFNLPVKSAGVFIAQKLIGFGTRKWGFHATLIGDSYLNFGLIGLLITTTVFGMILKTLYREFRIGSINNTLYALALVYSMRIFFESIEKYGETITVLSFAFLVMKLGQVLSLRKQSIVYRQATVSPNESSTFH